MRTSASTRAAAQALAPRIQADTAPDKEGNIIQHNKQKHKVS